MDSYAEEKLRLTAHELKGSPNRKKLDHAVMRTLIAVSPNDFPEHLRPKFEEIRATLLRRGKLSSTTVSDLTNEEFRSVWSGLKELIHETVGES